MDLLQRMAVLLRVLGCRFFGLKVPIACHYSITNRCPWNCVYCGFQNKDKAECNTQEAKEIIRQLANSGNVRLHLVGGEPALRQDLGELVQEAKRNKLFVTIASSGFQFSQIWERIKDIDIFFLSFDGPKEIHDLQRGVGAYDTLFSAIDFLKSKSKNFWTTTVLTKKNIGHIDYILDTAKRIGFKTNFHLLYFTSTQKYLEKSFHLPDLDNEFMADQDYRAALEYLLMRKKTDAAKIIAHSESYLRSLLEWKDYTCVYSSSKARRYKCWAGRMHCYVDANGDLYPCGDVMGRVEPRNILKLGLKDALKTMPKIPCESCLVACYNELNLLFSLDLEAVLNWNKIV